MRFVIGMSIVAFSFSAMAAVEKALPPTVIIEEVKEVADVQRVLTPARIDAKIQSLVISDIDGNVARLIKPLGSNVKKGDIVLYIENKDPGFTYAPVPVRSPIKGVISNVGVSMMTRVTKGTPLFSVIDPKSLKIVSEVASADLPFLRLGARGFFALGLTEKDLVFEVKLTGMSPLIDPRTGTASAEMEFLSAKDALPAVGTVGHSMFEINKGKTILIPESALTYKEGKPFVRIIGKDQVNSRKPITLGEQRESLFAIQSGLKPGEKIILRASRPLRDGEKVQEEVRGAKP